MSRWQRRKAAAAAWRRSLTADGDPPAQPGCTCDYRPLAERNGTRVADHSPACPVIAGGIQVQLIVGDGEPTLIGSIAPPPDGDLNYGIGLFLREWSEAYLDRLRAAGHPAPRFRRARRRSRREDHHGEQDTER